MEVEVVESAVECGLELSTFVGCGDSHLGRRKDSQDSRSRRRSEEGIALVVKLAARSRQKGMPLEGGKRKSNQTQRHLLQRALHPDPGSPTANPPPCRGRATCRVGAEQLSVAHKEKLCHMRTRKRLCLEPQVLSQLHSGVSSRCSAPVMSATPLILLPTLTSYILLFLRTETLGHSVMCWKNLGPFVKR